MVDGRRPSRVTRLGGRAGGAPPPLEGVGYVSFVRLSAPEVLLLYRRLGGGSPSTSLEGFGLNPRIRGVRWVVKRLVHAIVCWKFTGR